MRHSESKDPDLDPDPDPDPDPFLFLDMLVWIYTFFKEMLHSKFKDPNLFFGSVYNEYESATMCLCVSFVPQNAF